MKQIKTPEQMAEEYADKNSGGECSDDTGGLRNAFLAGYQAAMNSPKKLDSWISVKERLPEYDVDVLTFETGDYKVNAVSEYTQWWYDSNEGFERNPTHWQPLPKPPEDK